MKSSIIKTSKHVICGAALLLLNIAGKAQHVVVGASIKPDASTALHIESDSKGLLIPQVTLSSVTDAQTVPSALHSLLVYNTNNDIIGGQGEGFYYNSGTSQNIKWIKLLNQEDTWFLNGNTGITLNNFLGTTDNADVVIKRQNVEAIRIAAGGTVFTGDPVNGTIPASGAGVRAEWIPAKAAFRAGEVTGAQWEDFQIGVRSIAGGFNTIASGENSMAFGEFTRATGRSSAAFGSATWAQGDFSMAGGQSTRAGGQASLAVGKNTQALGAQSVAAGEQTKATGRNSIAAGFSTESAGDNSIALGEGTITNAFAGLVSGSWNVIHAANPTMAADNDKVFQIGKGTGNLARSDAMWVERDGDMMIAGCLTAKNGGPICGPSDIRLKRDIKSLADVLSKINTIQPIYFYYKDKVAFPADHQIGFSAQEVEKTFPELVKKVNEANGEYLAVNYANMNAVAIEAIKEQEKLISTNQSTIDKQTKQIKKQNENMAEQEKLIDLLDVSNQNLEKRIAELEKRASKK